MTNDATNANRPWSPLRVSPALEPETTPRHYWEDRALRFASEGTGLRAVCAFGMPWFYNSYIDLTQRLALRAWLRTPVNATVLDVGCGVGRWSLLLARSGARVTGIDLSAAMIEEARRRAEYQEIAGQCRFLTADLAELSLGERFDRILGVTVLQHIMDDMRLQAAVERLAAHLAPGGRLVLLEAAPTRPATHCDSAIFRAREMSVYRQAFERVGLRCLAIGGVDPAPFKTLYLPCYSRVPRPLALAGLLGVTALSLPVDVLAGRRLVRASWHKVFVLTQAGAS